MSLDSNFPDEIRRMLRVKLTDHDCNADRFSKFSAMHRRTLSRKLANSGFSYRTISNEVRFEIVRQLLEDTKMLLGEISAALGYSEASVSAAHFDVGADVLHVREGPRTGRRKTPHRKCSSSNSQRLTRTNASVNERREFLAPPIKRKKPHRQAGRV
ncbi:helix-turn-helix transcriptional regulator [Chelatococcus asaccharovorans]|uniref:helix-turn-helix transcriptional regulator n=1 Tax=Chelatococcus asaccharovorans TaxID=28210 RepID=UPI0011B37A79|nr:helix-turn-helix transcriptional regulator [Chelatococcus asaccharovorans]